jgi:hypothetical protein
VAYNEMKSATSWRKQSSVVMPSSRVRFVGVKAPSHQQCLSWCNGTVFVHGGLLLVARNPSRIDAKRGDRFPQADLNGTNPANFLEPRFRSTPGLVTARQQFLDQCADGSWVARVSHSLFK